MITLFTDTDNDVTPSFCEKYNYHLISMPYVMDEKEIFPYVDFNDFNSHEFYERLRGGYVPKTCAINPYDYIQYFEKFFEAGSDILYVHFSKELSGTFNALNIAIEELKEKYPDRKFYMIDTKGASVLGRIIVEEIGEMFLKGASVEEVMEWAKTEVDHFTVYFFVSDLKFLQKSGRVSGIGAFLGSVMNIKPIIYMDTNGKMTSVSTAHGKSGAFNKLINYVKTLGDKINEHKIYIAHSDSLENAIKLEKMLIENFGKDLNIEFVDINPTLGSHCGPSAIGVCFHSIRR